MSETNLESHSIWPITPVIVAGGRRIADGLPQNSVGGQSLCAVEDCIDCELGVSQIIRVCSAGDLVQKPQTSRYGTLLERQQQTRK
jgi:hypothetical protein